MVYQPFIKSEILERRMDSASLRLADKVGDFIGQGGWSDLPLSVPANIRHEVSIIEITEDETDVCFWWPANGGTFTVKLFYRWLQSRQETCPIAAKIWHNTIAPSHSLICWKAYSGYISTHEVLQKKGFAMVSICALCSQSHEDQRHLFVHCPFVIHIWHALISLFGRH